MRSKTCASFIGLAIIPIGSLELSGCGTTQGDRVLSGGLLGAGTGALIGSVTGSVGKGAVIGGLGGAALGALTSPDAINLGDPPWRHTSGYRHHYYASRAATRETCTARETSTQRITICPKGK
jgi:osmotically inducible lipoprotein OsmB